jgi:hypothetical protein
VTGAAAPGAGTGTVTRIPYMSGGKARHSIA